HRAGRLHLWYQRGGARLAVAEGLKVDPGVARPRTYVTGVDPLDVEALSWAEVTSRLHLLEMHRFLKAEIPGFEESFVERLGDASSALGGRFLDLFSAPWSVLQRRAGWTATSPL